MQLHSRHGGICCTSVNRGTWGKCKSPRGPGNTHSPVALEEQQPLFRNIFPGNKARGILPHAPSAEGLHGVEKEVPLPTSPLPSPPTHCWPWCRSGAGGLRALGTGHEGLLPTACGWQLVHVLAAMLANSSSCFVSGTGAGHSLGSHRTTLTHSLPLTRPLPYVGRGIFPWARGSPTRRVAASLCCLCGIQWGV